jgi:hypothetical protein
VPALAAAALIVALGLVYFGLRAARVDPKPVTSSALGLSFAIPQGWKQATQNAPQASNGRVALGSPGAKRQAMFITRYPLKRPVGSSKQAAKEARSWLLSTGAKGNIKLEEHKLAGADGLQAKFKAGGLTIQIQMLFKDRSSWQLSCQSLTGSAGASTRRACKEILDSVSVQ